MLRYIILIHILYSYIGHGEPYQIYHNDKPLLGISRSICHYFSKNVGVISEPEFYSYDFGLEGREELALVVGSDGLWAFLADEEVLHCAVSG